MANKDSATFYYVAGAASCFTIVMGAVVLAMFLRRRKKLDDQSGKRSIRNATATTYDSGGHLKSIPFFIQHKLETSEAFRPSLKASFSASDSEGGLITDSVQRLSWENSSLDYSSTASIDLEWRVWFKLIYDDPTENLKITIFRIKCMSSAAAPRNQTSVFFICYLLPDQATKQQTAMYLNNGNVYFDETLTFKVSKGVINEKRIRLSLYEMDSRRNRITLGHILIKLKEINIDNKTAHYLCRDTVANLSLIKESNGEVHLSLSYDREREKLRLQIFAAKSLPKVPTTSSFYMVTNVMVGAKTAKTKLGSIHPSLEGIFNVSYNFRLATKLMDNDSCCLRFTIMQINTIAAGKWAKEQPSTTPSPTSPANRIGVDKDQNVATSSNRATPFPSPTALSPTLSSESNEMDDIGGTAADQVDYDKKPWGFFVVGPNNFTHGTGLTHWSQMLANNKQVIEMWHKITEYEQ